MIDQVDTYKSENDEKYPFSYQGNIHCVTINYILMYYEYCLHNMIYFGYSSIIARNDIINIHTNNHCFN